jgi:hypothetical protein
MSYVSGDIPTASAEDIEINLPIYSMALWSIIFKSV